MKTQISRDSRQARKRYSGVYQQQGRMLTDADWNELVDILKARVDEALGQIVGSGAPKRAKTDGPLVPAKDKLAPGDLFADGVYARLRPSADQTGQFSYTQQADFPGAPALPAGDYLLYADVWERPVTALEDDGIRDPGLHGADTCTRTRTMVQVKWCPTAADLASVSKNPPCGNAAVTLVVHSGSDPSDGCDPCASEAKLSGSVGDYLF
ncbi:MAG: DUF6519 domain-containing protein, partial [Candidatus Solibacter sp.]|nr:DUF6519 domain-containing protein [Candidatus Solibacter sp.]